MSEKKYTITVTEHQLALISQCVEDCHRFAAGQTDLWNLLSMLPCEDMREARIKLQDVKPYVTGGKEYSWDGYGCKNPVQRKYIAETYCIYREILHRIIVLNPKDYDSYSCYDSKTLTCDDGGPLPKIELVKKEPK